MALSPLSQHVSGMPRGLESYEMGLFCSKISGRVASMGIFRATGPLSRVISWGEVVYAIGLSPDDYKVRIIASDKAAGFAG